MLGKKKGMLRRSAIVAIFGLKEIEQFLGYERGGAGYLWVREALILGFFMGFSYFRV